jgi:hypothetical protein
MAQQVVKIELKGKRLLEALQPLLKDQLPNDAQVEGVWHNPVDNTVGFIVGSKDYGLVEGGDLVLYAPALPFLSAKEQKEVIQGQASTETSGTSTSETQGQSSKTGK